MKLFVNVVPISNLHYQANFQRIGGLNSKTILCYVLVYCIILASRYNMIMYLSQLSFFYPFMLFVFLLPLMLVNKNIISLHQLCDKQIQKDNTPAPLSECIGDLQNDACKQKGELDLIAFAKRQSKIAGNYFLQDSSQ